MDVGLLKTMRRPDFFIVGAPKCGTSALYSYLSDHPRVFLCRPKEPNYFTDFDYPRLRYAKSERHYLDLFRRATDEHLAVGEASASYLLIGEALERLRDFNPAARLIIMLRNPVEMVFAWHSQLLYSFEETERDFREAWDLQAERRQGRQIPRLCRDPRVLLYKDAASFSRHLECVQNLFPQEKILLVLQEDLYRNTAEVYGRVLRFLGVPADGRTVFPKVNVARYPSNKRYWKWVEHRPRFLLRAARTAKRLLGLTPDSILSRLRLTRGGQKSRPPLSSDLRTFLIEEFRPEIGRLESLLEQDLGHWLK